MKRSTHASHTRGLVASNAQGPQQRWTAEETASIAGSIKRARIAHEAVKNAAGELAEGIVRKVGRPLASEESINDELERLANANKRAPRRPWTLKETVAYVENKDAAYVLRSDVERHQAALNKLLEYVPKAKAPKEAWLRSSDELNAIADACTLLALYVHRAIFAENKFLDSVRQSAHVRKSTPKPSLPVAPKRGRR